MHDKLCYDRKKCIGDRKHTEEEYEHLEPQLGLILLRTNDLTSSAESIYLEYKDHWG